MKTLTIGQLAKATSVSVETIRYYERRELLERPERPPSGYRAYPQTYIERIKFIKRAQDLGFTLNEIGELLALSAKQNSTCSDVKQKTEAKLQKIRQKIQELRAMQQALESMSSTCSGDSRPTSDCTILELMSNHSS